MIEKFEKITQSINETMGFPSSGELKELNERLSVCFDLLPDEILQFKFEVFKMGRRLVKQGEAMKQTRKELQVEHHTTPPAVYLCCLGDCALTGAAFLKQLACRPVTWCSSTTSFSCVA